MQVVGEERRHNSTPDDDSLAAGRQGCGNRDAHPGDQNGTPGGDRALKRRRDGGGGVRSCERPRENEAGKAEHAEPSAARHPDGPVLPTRRVREPTTSDRRRTHRSRGTSSQGKGRRLADHSVQPPRRDFDGPAVIVKPVGRPRRVTASLNATMKWRNALARVSSSPGMVTKSATPRRARQAQGSFRPEWLPTDRAADALRHAPQWQRGSRNEGSVPSSGTCLVEKDSRVFGRLVGGTEPAGSGHAVLVMSGPAHGEGLAPAAGSVQQRRGRDADRRDSPTLAASPARPMWSASQAASASVRTSAPGRGRSPKARPVEGGMPCHGLDDGQRPKGCRAFSTQAGGKVSAERYGLIPCFCSAEIGSHAQSGGRKGASTDEASRLALDSLARPATIGSARTDGARCGRRWARLGARFLIHRVGARHDGLRRCSAGRSA